MPLFKRKLSHEEGDTANEGSPNRWWGELHDSANPVSAPYCQSKGSPTRSILRNGSTSGQGFTDARRATISVIPSSPLHTPKERRGTFASLPSPSVLSSCPSPSIHVAKTAGGLRASSSLSQLRSRAPAPRNLNVDTDRLDRACGQGPISASTSASSLSALADAHASPEKSPGPRTSEVVHRPSRSAPHFPFLPTQQALKTLSRILQTKTVNFRLGDYIEQDELLSGRMWEDEEETLVDCVRDRLDDEDGEDGVWRLDRRERRRKSQAERERRNKEGNVFGTHLQDLPTIAMSRILVGGFTHIVPMVVDACVEEIYRTGVYQRDLFHTLPNRERLLQLVSTFDNGSPPRRPSGPPDASTSKGTLYAIPPSMEKELTPNVCALLVTYLSALPDTIIHRSLSDALWAWCVSPSLIRQQERSRRRGDDDASESEQEASDEEDENAPSFNTRLRLMELERENLPPFKIQILIAQHVLLLLPPRHFSLLIHLMTFFATLQLCPENGVGLEDIGRIFGPTIVGGKVRKRNKRDDEKDIERAVKGEKDEKEKKIMVWLVSHWERIAQAYEMEDPEMVRRRSQVGSMRREASRSSERGWSAGRAVDKKRPSSDEDSRDERRPSTVESLTSGTTASTSDFSEDDVPVISPSQFRSALGSETKEGDHRLDAMTGDEDRSQPVNEDLPAYDSHASSKYRGSSRDFTLPDIGTDPSTGELSSSVRQFFLENDETGGHPTDLGEPNLAHHSGKANSTPSVIPHDRSHTSADITRGLSASIPAPRRTSRLAEDARLATQFVLQRENAELRRQLDKALSERDEARGLMATMRSILDATSKQGSCSG